MCVSVCFFVGGCCALGFAFLLRTFAPAFRCWVISRAACVTSGKRYIVHPLGTLPLLLWRCSRGIWGWTF